MTDKVELQLTDEDAIALRAYAAALQDLLYVMTGRRNDDGQPESLSISVAGSIICSHAFRLGSDSPIHMFSEFESITQIKGLMLEEIADELAVGVAGEIAIAGSYNLARHRQRVAESLGDA